MKNSVRSKEGLIWWFSEDQWLNHEKQQGRWQGAFYCCFTFCHTYLHGVGSCKVPYATDHLSLAQTQFRTDLFCVCVLVVWKAMAQALRLEPLLTPAAATVTSQWPTEVDLVLSASIASSTGRFCWLDTHVHAGQSCSTPSPSSESRQRKKPSSAPAHCQKAMSFHLTFRTNRWLWGSCPSVGTPYRLQACFQKNWSSSSSSGNYANRLEVRQSCHLSMINYLWDELRYHQNKVISLPEYLNFISIENAQDSGIKLLCFICFLFNR